MMRSKVTYMSTLLLFNAGSFKVLIRHSEMSLHLLQRLSSNRVDAELFLALGKEEP